MQEERHTHTHSPNLPPGVVSSFTSRTASADSTAAIFAAYPRCSDDLSGMDGGWLWEMPHTMWWWHSFSCDDGKKKRVICPVWFASISDCNTASKVQQRGWLQQSSTGGGANQENWILFESSSNIILIFEPDCLAHSQHVYMYLLQALSQKTSPGKERRRSQHRPDQSWKMMRRAGKSLLLSSRIGSCIPSSSAASIVLPSALSGVRSVTNKLFFGSKFLFHPIIDTFSFSLCVPSSMYRYAPRDYRGETY